MKFGSLVPPSKRIDQESLDRAKEEEPRIIWTEPNRQLSDVEWGIILDDNIPYKKWVT